MTTQSCHLHRLLSLFDPLLSRPALVVEAYYRPARGLQVSHDEPHSWKQLPGMELYIRHHTPRRLPARGLIEAAHVPDHRLVAPSSYRPLQQLRDVALQGVVGRDADSILYAPLFQRLADLRLGEGRIGTKDYLLAQFLLSLSLRQ